MKAAASPDIRIAYIPSSPAMAGRLRSEGRAVSVSGFTAQFDNLTAGPDEQEEAEFAALNLAGVAALTLPNTEGPRLVLAAEVTIAQLSGNPTSPVGEVEVRNLRWPQVQALFADDAAALAAVARARSTATGCGLGEALEIAEVGELLNSHDLLWYAPSELDQLAS